MAEPEHTGPQMIEVIEHYFGGQQGRRITSRKPSDLRLIVGQPAVVMIDATLVGVADGQYESELFEGLGWIVSSEQLQTMTPSLPTKDGERFRLSWPGTVVAQTNKQDVVRYTIAYQRLGDVTAYAGGTYCLVLLVIRAVAGACRSAAASTPSSSRGDVDLAHEEEEHSRLEGSHMLQQNHQAFDEPSSEEVFINSGSGFSAEEEELESVPEGPQSNHQNAAQEAKLMICTTEECGKLAITGSAIGALCHAPANDVTPDQSQTTPLKSFTSGLIHAEPITDQVQGCRLGEPHAADQTLAPDEDQFQINLYSGDGDFDHSFENGKHVPEWRGPSEKHVMLDRCRDRLKPIASIVFQPAWTDMQKDSIVAAAQQRGLVHRRFINAWGVEEMCASAVSHITIRELLDERCDAHAVVLPLAIAAKTVHDYLWTAHGFNVSAAPTGKGLKVTLLESALLYGDPLARAVQDQRDAAPPRTILKASRTGAFGNSLGGLFGVAAGLRVGQPGLVPAAGGLFGAAAAEKEEAAPPGFRFGAASTAKQVPAAATGENLIMHQYTQSNQTHRKSRTKQVKKKVKRRQATPKKLFLAGCESSQIEENDAIQIINPQIQQLMVPMENLAITPPQNIQNSVAAEMPARQTKVAMVQSLQDMMEQMTQATVLGKWRSNVKLGELNMQPRERATENARLAAQMNKCTTSTNDLSIAIADARSPTIRELECPVCLFELISFILLPCSHVFCGKCLEQLGEVPKKTGDLCPLCHLPVTCFRRLVTPLPPTDSSLYEESRACLTEAPLWTTWFSAAASADVVGTMVTDDQHQYAGMRMVCAANQEYKSKCMLHWDPSACCSSTSPPALHQSHLCDQHGVSTSAVAWDAIAHAIDWVKFQAANADLELMDSEAPQVQTQIDGSVLTINGTAVLGGQEEHLCVSVLLSPRSFTSAWCSSPGLSMSCFQLRVHGGGCDYVGNVKPLSGTCKEQRRASYKLLSRALLQAYHEHDCRLLWVLGIGLPHSAISKQDPAFAVSMLTLTLQIGSALQPCLSVAVVGLYAHLGELQEAAGDFAGAVLSYKRLISEAAKDNPSDGAFDCKTLPTAWNYLGLAYKRSGNYASARLAYTQALKISRRTLGINECACYLRNMFYMFYLNETDPDNQLLEVMMEGVCELFDEQMQQIFCGIENGEYDKKAMKVIRRDYTRNGEYSAELFHFSCLDNVVEHGELTLKVPVLGKSWHWDEATGSAKEQPAQTPNLKYVPVVLNAGCKIGTRTPKGPESPRVRKSRAAETKNAKAYLRGNTKEQEKVVCQWCYSEVSRSKVKLCGGCKAIHYCSKQCAKRDWNQHRLSCAKKGL